MNELRRILQALEQAQNTGKRAVLATIMRTYGSVYRRPGARMLLTEDGHMSNSISGGCLETDILERSHSLFSSGGAPILIRYDTTSSDDVIFGLGLGCNGGVEILLESLNGNTISHLDFIRECLNTQQMGAIATVFSVDNVPHVKVGDRLMMRPDTTLINQIANENLTERIVLDTYKILFEKQNRVQSYPSASGHIDVLIEMIRPPVPLLIFGAGHDAIPVVQFAHQLGWHVTVVDHRPEHLTGDRFSLADQVRCCKPEHPETYSDLLTPQTVAVVMSHRYLTDLAFLKTLLPAQLRYVGVLGPKQRIRRLWQDLAEQGVALTPERNQRIHSPIGLDIGAETPEEIALSIVAEIQAVLSERPGQHLRDRIGSIHSPSEPSCLGSVS